jgi:hypothetical protein
MKLRKNMRKIGASLLALIMSMSVWVMPVWAGGMTESTSRVFINGAEVATGERGNVALNINGSTYLPVRAMNVAFDRQVHWEPGPANLYFGTRANPAASNNLVVTTPAGAATISLEQVLAMDMVNFTANDRGNNLSFRGVPLTAVFSAMGVNVADAHSFIFMAADGMSSTADAADVLNPVNGFLVIEENGQRYTAREDGGRGPFRVVLVGDDASGRWARMLMEIIVVTEPGTPVLNREINIIADGNRVNAVDAAGSPAEPFMLGGVIYMPLRAVATGLGMPVAWSAAENAIFIGDIPQNLETESGGELTINAGGQQLTITME